MARKTAKTVIGEDGGRDKGKCFLITEMPASKAEKWATRALLLLSRSGIDFPEDMLGSGMAGIAVYGLRALPMLNFHEAEPLLDEMWDCLQIIPDPAHPNVTRTLIEDDIEEISTRIKLRTEIFNIHVSFSPPGAGSNTTSEIATGSVSENVKTYPKPSPPASHPGRRRSGNLTRNMG